jgi:gluconolactonase
VEVTYLTGDLGFTEGPVFRRSGELLVTAVAKGLVHSIGPAGTALLAVTGGGPNGAAEGLDGSVYIAQNGGRRIGAPEPAMAGGVQRIRDGVVTWISQDQVAPNDLCFGPDGMLYVTDPTRRRSRDDGRIWRIHPDTGQSQLLASVGWYPNGIGFGLEDDALYVASTGERAIRRFRLTRNGLSDSEIVIRMPSGFPDGFAFDEDGRIVLAAFGSDPPQREGPAGELQVWTADGSLLEVLHPSADRSYSNVALDENRRLAVTGTDSGRVLLLEPWPARGLTLHPFRNTHPY